MSHINHRHALRTHKIHSLKLGICTLDFVKCLKIFGEMLAVVSWNGGGEVIFVTLSTFLCFSNPVYGIWKERGLYF